MLDELDELDELQEMVPPTPPTEAVLTEPEEVEEDIFPDCPPPTKRELRRLARAETPRKNIGGILLLLLALITVTAFSIFCIWWDIRKGSTSGGYTAGEVVEVFLGQQQKPAAAEELADENGRYTIAGIAQVVMPSIVEIHTYRDGAPIASGTGILLTADGYLVTNAHVISDGDHYSVTLHDERRFDGERIGHDTKTDIAVLKIEASGLTPAAIGDSDTVILGEEVCALGNPAGLTGSISAGIISGLHRQIQSQSNTYIMDCFQTDAAISSGNSGGALVNRYGQVIGITSSKYTSGLFSGGSYEGLGFAITINEALPIITELMTQGYVGGRVRIGIQFYEAEAVIAQEEITVPEALRGKGILVTKLDADSDLNQTTFQAGDWILEMNGKSVSDYDSVCAAIEGIGAGERVHAHCAHVNEDESISYYEIDFTLLEDTSGEY